MSSRRNAVAAVIILVLAALAVFAWLGRRNMERSAEGERIPDAPGTESDAPPAHVPPAPPPPEPPPVPHGKTVDYGGGVVVMPDERIVVLKGRTCVAANEGLEWAVVLYRGKEYESVVAVEADASMIQFALFALGYTPGGNVDVQGDPRTPLGDRLVIEVEWEREGKTVRRRIEDLVWNLELEQPMKRTHFVFTGSRMQVDPETNSVVFLADVERLVAALYRDPAAILNNPLETGVDDIYYIANRRTLPPKGTPVTVYM
ncbi:MAG TPA: hypothetical protein ENN09_02635, partial [Planctomycetes bacterium]|nr:hypothetical protein [Planctomycetota bacterium]